MLSLFCLKRFASYHVAGFSIVPMPQNILRDIWANGIMKTALIY